MAGSPAWTQEAAQTAGGDVTADEATPLPPVVVSAPGERQARRVNTQVSTPPPAASAPSAPASDIETIATAGSGSESFATAPGNAVGVFTLGQLDLIGGATITNEAMWTYSKQSLDSAVNILPGVSTSNSGNSRNEKDVYVRGFDRFRVPLYQDGVRIYLPYDNRLDFNRFLTDDLAEIQVQKGYVSVLNGPGGLGGAINLVSRKPTKAIELEGRSGAVFNGELDGLNQWSGYAFAGTRQDMWYAQLSGNIVDRDAFNLSNDFNPANVSGPGFFPYENGGDRDRSDFHDWRINSKIGLTPNATDEYVVNYTNQQGEKGAPLHIERAAVQGYSNGNHRRFWDWPQWDTSSLSWLSKTQLGAASYVKTNAYYNTFDNTTRFFRDPLESNPPGNFAPYDRILFESVYDDNSKGGFVELGTSLIPMNTLKGAIHFRRDEHNEYALNHAPSGAFSFRGPTQTQSEETWSFALENTFHATRNIDFVAGASYDTNEVLRADGNNDPLPELDAWNTQGALVYSYGDAGKVYSSISSRTRFPTLFERYSTRFGSQSQNPGLDEERSTNYEIGWSDKLFRQLKLSSAIFYSDLDDSIQSAFTRANGNNSIVVLNVDGENYGLELSADWDVMRTLRVGGNYTYMERKLDFAAAANQQPSRAFAIAASEAEGTPRHEFFLYAAWRATEKLTLTPSMEIASDRSSLIKSCLSTLPIPGSVTNRGGCAASQIQSTAATARPNYERIGSYALLNFQAEYAFTDNASLAVGATNVLDENYTLSDGFPEAGRQFFANARVKF